jgi:hypothetical protein
VSTAVVSLAIEVVLVRLLEGRIERIQRLLPLSVKPGIQGYAHRIIQELDKLVNYDNTPKSAIPILKQVRDYLKTHLAHVQYPQFKALNLPIGSGLVVRD